VDEIEFIVYGVPAPQGSKQAYAIYKGKAGAKQFTGKVALVEMSKRVKPWRAEVAAAARALGLAGPILGPVSVDMVFSQVRPKSHYRTGANAHLLRDTAPPTWCIAPDLSKLVRSTEDALKGIVWTDDKVVVEYGRLAKVYSDSRDPDALDRPGAVIRVRPFIPACALALPELGGAA
jgi:Holliday junction resolvase RusA-like endonuclease